MDAYAVYLVLQGVRGLGLGLVIVAPIYQIQLAHFGPLELLLTGTALEVAYFVSETPTGVVADLYSRRLSCIVAGFVMGAGWLLEGSVPRLWPILVSQAILGAGWTFFSGAADAWVAGEVGDERAAHAIVRGQQSNLVFVIVGGFIGAGLGTIRLNVPIIVAGVSHIALAVFLVAAMREDAFVRTVGGERLRNIGRTIRNGVRATRRNRVLVLIFVSMFLMGAASEGLDRLWEAHLYVDYKLPALGAVSRLYWFAIISGVATALSVAAVGISRRFVQRESDRALATTMVVMAALVAGGTALFGAANGVALAIVAYWIVRIGRNVIDPATNVWTIRHADPSVRATVLSIMGQSHSIGEIVDGPFAGLIGRLISIPAALLTSAALEAAAIPLLAGEALRASPITPDEPPPPGVRPNEGIPGAEPIPEF